MLLPQICVIVLIYTIFLLYSSGDSLKQSLLLGNQNFAHHKEVATFVKGAFCAQTVYLTSSSWAIIEVDFLSERLL